MSDLLLKPVGTHGKVHDITPEAAGWSYVAWSGFEHAHVVQATHERAHR